MWTSYEAICELGGPPNSSDEADDPNSIFGVPAPALSPRNDESAMGVFRRVLRNDGHVNTASNANTTAVNDDASALHDPLGSFKINRYGTPSTPYSGFDKMKIGAAFTNNNSQLFTAEASTREATGVNFHLPATASTIANRNRDMNTSSLPQTNLFAATPALGGAAQQSFRSPIIETPGSAAVSGARGATGGATPHDNAPSSAIGYANQVLNQARRVAAGLYYEPSPEATDPRTSTPKGRRMCRLSFAPTTGITSVARTNNDDPGTNLSFSSTPPTTPLGAPSPFNAGVSSVKGEKRTLFTANDLTSRKKSGQEKKKGEELTPPVEMTPAQKEDDGDVAVDLEAESKCVGQVLQLLCSFGAAYKYLCQHRSQDALELFRELPSSQINTGWVQHQIGKAYFEMSDYQNAERALGKMQRAEPHRMKGLDILSTALWHLKKEVELSDLAQKAVDFDRMSPEAWFVVGNCFSFQKEQETAITFFHRSIQLDPTYTYAHTMCGHEYMSNEDFEKAISCYRDAIRVDCRHYNAWYGLGAIYFRQEKFDLAEYHFQRALDINRQSSVLHCHLGMAQHHNGKTFEALDTLAGAFLLDPRNPQAHYQRATIFMSLDRPDEALAELEKVRSAAPREASVHYNMGKVLKRLGRPEKAMRCFLTALDLDPKDNNLIKAAMDRLDEPDVEEEVSVF